MPFKTPPPLYSVWMSMKARCFNPKAKQWADYGGRGILVCDAWMTYANFERDMLPRPKGYSIERIDTNGHYEKSNCRWATRKEQQRNQRRTIWVTIEGQQFKAIELAEKSGLKVDTIVKRAAAGMTYKKLMAKTYYINPSNTRAATERRVANQRAKTHCKRGHEWSSENTGRQKGGARYCRRCHNLKVQRQRARKRALCR